LPRQRRGALHSKNISKLLADKNVMLCGMNIKSDVAACTTATRRWCEEWLSALARQRSGIGSLKGIFKRCCDEERGFSRALDRDHGGGARQDLIVDLTSRPSLEYDVNDASTASSVRPCEAARRG
jgi:hypothetical protein